jgi:hypothetical protein
VHRPSDWFRQINEEISRADVGVLFVSADYLASEWITAHELPTLFKAGEEKGLRILWVAVSPSLYSETAVSQFQALNDPSKPLETLNRGQREAVISQALRRIAEVAGRKY